MKAFALILALVTCAAAQQTMVGLDKHGVTLTGNAIVPIITNHSGKEIFGYTMRFYAENGYGSPANMLFISIADGEEHVTVGSTTVDQMKRPHSEIYPEGHHPAGPIIVSLYPITKVVLDGVVFHDKDEYTFVGPDTEHMFDSFSTRMQIAADLGSQLLAANDKGTAWESLKATAMKSPEGRETTVQFGRRAAATVLVGRFNRLGSEAALTLAAEYAALPALKRGEQ